ncbi:HET-domain-containing protein [Hypoxylon rubiginosum]|uniref:HET-domain-containing protein n=1 Tax=Hypoxylon rubiginosum TaxID=110542 RepID=A0ACB9YVU1_9PEZI|nr:HET-domain-containing protein [Hypoxylon rubiginosum]
MDLESINDTFTRNEDDIYDSAVLNNPCNFCRVLEINELKHGGEIRTSRNGKPYVSFGIVQDTRANRKSFYIIKEANELASFPKTAIQLGYSREDLFPNLPKLAETALQGCAFCDMLRKDLMCVWEGIALRLKYDPSDHTEADYARLHITKVTYQYHGDDIEKVPWLDTLLVDFTVTLGSKEEQHYIHYNFSTEDFDACASWLNIWRRPTPCDGFSALRSERLKELIHMSLSEVPYSTEDAYLPTRLVDVGSNPIESPRLIISRDYQPLTEATDPALKRYAALSYCWGSKEEADQQLKTTKDTLDDHLQRIEFEKLPRTIADAVKVCREIGIRYIWVDALCIIQGDKDDWNRESYAMSKVYSKSFLTLCIARGSSCLNGFLGRSNTRRTLRINFRSTLDTSVSGMLYLRKRAGYSMYQRLGYTDHPGRDDISRSAWRTRGWTYQESLLSPRKVYFGDHMFHFSCGKLGESEDGTRFDADDRYKTFSQPWTESKPDTKAIMSDWRTAVAAYSNRRLSYETDRLPAISALARIISDLLPGQRYLAGLWESDLQNELLWTHGFWDGPEAYFKPFEERTAPSWTWACDKHAVSWLWTGSPFTAEFQLREAEIAAHEINPYGHVDGGHLLLYTKVFQLSSLGDGKATFRSASMWMSVVFYYILQSDEKEYIAHICLDWDRHGRHNTSGYPHGPVGRLSMVLISSSSLNGAHMSSRPYLTDPSITLGLLVLKTDGGDGFKKVGLFYSENRDQGGRKFWDSVEPREIRLV